MFEVIDAHSSACSASGYLNLLKFLPVSSFHWDVFVDSYLNAPFVCNNEGTEDAQRAGPALGEAGPNW
ncbi:hypothetical protein AVEN_99798-1, partial [Araneus ventricosus]